MLILLFAISFCVLIFLIGAKVYEKSRGRTTFASRFLSRFDDRVKSRENTTRDAYTREKNRVTTFTRTELPRRATAVVKAVKEGAKAGYKSVIPNIRGVRVLHHNREASPFLQDIAKAQELDGKGRIEDEGISKL